MSKCLKRPIIWYMPKYGLELGRNSGTLPRRTGTAFEFQNKVLTQTNRLSECHCVFCPTDSNVSVHHYAWAIIGNDTKSRMLKIMTELSTAKRKSNVLRHAIVSLWVNSSKGGCGLFLRTIPELPRRRSGATASAILSSIKPKIKFWRGQLALKS